MQMASLLVYCLVAAVAYRSEVLNVVFWPYTVFEYCCL